MRRVGAIGTACLICFAGRLARGADVAPGVAKCQVSRLAELPITMNSLRPTIVAKINGKEARFFLDSGAFYSLMSTATAAEFDLPLKKAPYGLALMGVGGRAEVKAAMVQEFDIAGFTINKIEFLVGGSDVSFAGLLGQNFLQQFDVEYDLASGVVRLFHTRDCDKADLAYWLKPGQSYSVMTIDKTTKGSPHTAGTVYINDKATHAMFDTGASTSVITPAAAVRAGVTAASPGVVDAGASRGFGQGMSKTFIAPFSSFKIGDGEEIHRVKLRVAELSIPGVDMLIGADFFLSHRIFVANKEQRLYLSYNGGPVFDLSLPPAVTNTVVAADERTDQAEVSGDTVADAADIARRGSALAARREFVPALEALTKAIELSPNNPEYYFQRGNALRDSGQADLALNDFSHAITLKPDFLPAYLPRAELYLAKQDTAAGLADFDTVSRLAPKSADLRFMLAQMYQHLERFPEAIAEYTLWIQYHEVDSRFVMALHGRALSSALQNQDLSTALKDCDEALRRVAKSDYPNLWVVRGLVRLRRGEYRLAISDFGDAIDSLPKPALALYGRSVAESRYHMKKQSVADLVAAEKLDPKISESYAKFGIVP